MAEMVPNGMLRHYPDELVCTYMTAAFILFYCTRNETSNKISVAIE